MAVQPYFRQPNVFRIIAHFSQIADPTFTWRSTMDVFKSATNILPTDDIIGALRDFWLYNVSDTATLDVIEARNWTMGDVPFDLQGALWRDEIGIIGKKFDALGYGSLGDPPTPLGGEVCALVKRIPNDTGRSGSMFIRGFIDGGDVVGQTGGKWVYKTVTRVTPAKFQGTIDNSGLRAFLGVEDPGIVVIHHHELEDHATTANCTNLTLRTTISVNKQTRKSRR